MKKFRWHVLLSICLFCILSGVTLWRRSHSREFTVQRIVQALQSKDVDALLEMTLKEEKEKCHLTKENVKAYLDATLWKQDFHELYIVPSFQNSVDEVIYTLKPKSNKFTVPLFVCLQPDGQWYIALSMLLYQSAKFQKKGEGVMDHIYAWQALSEQHSIYGLRTNVAGYQMTHGH